MNLLQFLKWLNGLGDALPAVLKLIAAIQAAWSSSGPAIEAIIAAFKELLGALSVNGAPGKTFPTFSAGPMSAVEEAEAENLLAELAAKCDCCKEGVVAGPFDRWDGSRIRDLWQWLNEHPAVISIIGFLL